MEDLKKTIVTIGKKLVCYEDIVSVRIEVATKDGASIIYDSVFDPIYKKKFYKNTYDYFDDTETED